MLLALLVGLMMPGEGLTEDPRHEKESEQYQREAIFPKNAFHTVPSAASCVLAVSAFGPAKRAGTVNADLNGMTPLVMQNLIQILLPLYGADGMLLPVNLFADVKAELIDKFGGLTAYTRSPAEGRWMDSERDVRDEIVIYEIMVPEVDTEWWRHYRLQLETLFGQKELIVRALPMTRL